MGTYTLKKTVSPGESSSHAMLFHLFSPLSGAFKKVLMLVPLLLLMSSLSWAQYFVKEISGMGTTEPKVFKSSMTPDYYLTATSTNLTYISLVNAAGNIVATHSLNFPGDVAVIRDLVVDWVDNTLAGIAIGNNSNYIFKYDFSTSTFNWIQSYSKSYVFENIHQVSTTTYIVTGEILRNQMIIFEVNRATGATGYQNTGFVGEFRSTFDGTDIYGACRYYTGSFTFNPSVFRFKTTTGGNAWTNGYISNFGTLRIYPLAPIVDGTDVVTLCSGSANTFDTYLTGLTDLWLFKTDLSGNLAWTKQITIPGYKRLNARKIINTSTGYYLLVDAYNGTFVNFFFIIKTDKSGNLQWINRYGICQTNSVISGVEDNGDIYLTALSGSYGPNTSMLFLKLNPNGLTGAGCPFIQSASATIANYGNSPAAKGTATNSTSFSGSPFGPASTPAPANEIVHCNSTGGGGGGGGGSLFPCNTLAGSLSNGVLAFYPFGYGSLNDLSGNGFTLTNPTTASPVVDRNGNNSCAYHFIKANSEFLTISSSNSWFLNGITNGAFSVSLWYQPTGTRPVNDYELLLGRNNVPVHCPDTWGEWSLGLYDCRKVAVGMDQYSHWQTSGTTPCATFLANVSNLWHHLAFVYDGYGNYNIFVDGILYVNSSGPCGAMSGNIGAMLLGSDYTGDLDDVIIYNRAITAAEVSALMALNGSCCDGVSSSNKPATKNVPKTVTGKSITVYPNTTDGIVNITSEKGNIRTVYVSDNTGRIVGTYHFDKAEVSFNVDKLAAGMYFIRVITDSEETTEKLIKR